MSNTTIFATTPEQAIDIERRETSRAVVALLAQGDRSGARLRLERGWHRQVRLAGLWSALSASGTVI